MNKRIEVELKGEVLTLSPRGAWCLSGSAELIHAIESLSIPDHRAALIDGSRLDRLDTAGAALLIKLAQRLKNRVHTEPNFANFAPPLSAVLDLVRERYKPSELPAPMRLSIVQEIGRSTVHIGGLVLSLLSFVGEIAFAMLDVLRRPSRFRLGEFMTQLKIGCMDAIPIVGLVTFLIGVVIAYLSAIQIEKYGANIFIVDAVALAMCRELSPIIVAVVVAGRSGSAYTAQIGTMKLNEEIDAITTLGLSPLQVLVIPRVCALILAMPLLVFVGDVVGLMGSVVIAKGSLGITLPTFLERLQNVLPVRSLMVGLIKAPVFAAFIATIGCNMGLTVENNARSIGLHTTSTVVQSIVAVILLNAAFAILFVELGI